MTKSCCVDPRILGGRCDNCGTWIDQDPADVAAADALAAEQDRMSKEFQDLVAQIRAEDDEADYWSRQRDDSFTWEEP